MLEQLKKDIEMLADPEKAVFLRRFFKTGKGEYGEGDVFLGITVPKQRLLAKKYQTLALSDLQSLLNSEIHEYRLLALIILVEKYKKAAAKRDVTEKEAIIDFYLTNTKQINNWDLVDLSADKILGEYLFEKKYSSDQSSYDKVPGKGNRSNILELLARSENLWEKRIAILSTFAFIKKNHFEETLETAGILLYDKHDLIQKALGWMLREIGKRDLETEEKFLKKYYKTMSRTMLRYAIEHFHEEKRKFYLGKK